MPYFRYLLLLFLCLIYVSSVEADASREYQQLKDSLRSAFVGKGDEVRNIAELQQLTQQPKIRKKLLQFAFLDRFSPKVVDQITAEDQGKAFMEALYDNPIWMQMLLISGPIDHSDLTLSHLASIWKKDPESAKKKDLQTLSIAIALEFGKHQWPKERAWDRYVFYRDSQKLELLHPIYDKLEAWEKRYLVGHALSMHGGVKSQVWLRDNVKLTAEGYRHACWQVAYRSFNVFDDTVQGPMYYYPFEGSFNSFSEMTRYVGGVCGRLSGYGAAAAVANGIPATTMGEPGHCAYTVRVARGKWMPAYSLSWKRGVHVQFYGKSFNLLVLTDAIFSDHSSLLKANEYLWWARVFAPTDPSIVRRCFQKALQAQPINYEAWQAYGDWLSSQKGNNIAEWRKFHSFAIKSFSDYPEVAWMLIKKYAYPHLLKNLSVSDKMRLMGEFHKSILQWGPNRWDFERALTAQVKLIGGTRDDEFTFFQGVLREHKKSPAYSGATLRWAEARFKKSLDERKRFIVIATRIMASETSEDGKNPLYRMASQIILDAEKNKDPDAFALAGSMLKQIHPAQKKKVKPAFSGELLSDGAFVRTSGTCGYDTPWKHYFLPSNESGFFHTPRQMNPWVELTLKQFGVIRGIEVVNWTRFRSRAVPLKVEVSEDGKTWTEIALLKKPQAVWKIDLKGKNIRARHIRLTKQGNDFLHLNNVRVYGKRRS